MSNWDAPVLIGVQLLIGAISSLALLWLNNQFYNFLLKIPNLSKQHYQIKKTKRSLRLLILIISFVAGALLTSLNLWSIYQGNKVSEIFFNFIQSSSSEQLIDLVFAAVKSILLLGCVFYTNCKIPKLLEQISIFMQNIDNLEQNDESIANFFNLLSKTVTKGLWILAIVVSLNFFNINVNISKGSYTFVKIYLIMSIALLINKSPLIIIDTIDSFSKQFIYKYPEENRFRKLYIRVKNIIPFLVKTIEFLVLILALTLCVKQIETVAGWSIWGERIIKAIVIIFASRILTELFILLIDEAFLNKNSQTIITSEHEKIYNTLIPLIKSITNYLIIFISGIMILYAFDIDPLPLLAGAGLIGFGFSMAAQDSIKDFIAGFFIVLENQFMVGDYVQIEQAEGYVQSLEFRTTIIRHPLGHQYILHNGSIKTVTNYSKQGEIYIDIDIIIPIYMQVSEIHTLIEKVGKNLQNKYPDLLEIPKINSITKINDEHSLSVNIRAKIKPREKIEIAEVIKNSLQEAINNCIA